MYAVQRAFTYEWVTVSTHEFPEDAQDAALEAMEDERPDTVRVIPITDER
jgi:hypothetical protein